MNSKNIIFTTIIFIAMGIMGVYITFESITGRSPITMLDNAEEKSSLIEYRGKCTSKPKTLNLETSENIYLKELAVAESICDSFVTDELMIFVDMPKDRFLAEESADSISEVLKEFDKYDITPIVIVEPVSEWGLIDFEEFSSGFYSKWIYIYFARLKSNGITDEMMGTWIPFPEANLPYWNRSDADPTQFSDAINEYVPILKTHYPDTRVGVLLNSATYSTKDFNWSDGEYTSLVPWVEEINPGLIDLFGLQGFPWHPSAVDDYEAITNPEEFLNPNLAMDAADSLGINEIWFNTGTYSSKYTLDPSNSISIDQFERKEIIDNILKNVTRVRSYGYSVELNIFAEDKSATEEATNWSYWTDPDELTDQNIYIFKSLLRDSDELEVDLSLFLISDETR